MTNELATTKILPPDAFANDGNIEIDLLLCDGKTGVWSYGIDKDEVAIGTQAVAVVDQIQKGFVRFDDDGPIRRFLPIWPTPDLDALRQSLGDLDETQWTERTTKGLPQDPWRPARQLPVILLRRTLDCLVYSSSSRGGVIAVSGLSRAVQHARRDPENAAALPIVSLDVDPYTQPKYGTIYNPVLKILRWTTHGAVTEMMRTGDFDKLADDASDGDTGDDDDGNRYRQELKRAGQGRASRAKARR